VDAAAATPRVAAGSAAAPARADRRCTRYNRRHSSRLAPARTAAAGAGRVIGGILHQTSRRAQNRGSIGVGMAAARSMHSAASRHKSSR
jgi:hypothetical protein